MRITTSLVTGLLATALGLPGVGHAQSGPRDQPWDPEYEPPKNEFGQP